MLPEVEVEDESVMPTEYVALMKSHEVVRKVDEEWSQTEKEKDAFAGSIAEPGKDLDQGASSVVRADDPATVRGLRRTDTEEAFN
jgi:hypothetical protein